MTSLASAPLAQVVGEVLKQSDNNGAELFTKELGRLAGSPTTAGGRGRHPGRPPGRRAAGQPAVAMVDGSGLDRSDRVDLSAARRRPAAQRPDRAPSGAGLPVAGRSGNLERRLVGTPAATRLRAKSGTLDAVSQPERLRRSRRPPRPGWPRPPP